MQSNQKKYQESKIKILKRISTTINYYFLKKMGYKSKHLLSKKQNVETIQIVLD